MKHIALIIVMVLVANITFAQTEKTSYKIVAEKFEKNFNEDNFDIIFSMFSDDMKKAVPLNKITAFLTNLKSQAGKITNREFVTYENGSVALYKTNFERALYGLNISLDHNSNINGFMVKPFKDNRNLPKIERNTTKLILPFRGEWTVLWGGDTQELNYHVIEESQKNAFDILITNDKGQSYKTDGLTNEDYYAFGKELIAPCDGEVVLVVDGVKDNTPGTMNPVYIPGNTVIIKTANGEYLFFAHFKQLSIKVKQGQKVKQGDLLGLCGNSGNSTEPHLHFHIQNVENLTIATGAKCYFDEILVNGELKTNYSPIKDEKIRNK
ncbi:peptidase M23 [Flavobacteriales bacterium 33_180_T64]|nr:peptidase M23 [Flavobacteriales bacterium 33_180_T64]